MKDIGEDVENNPEAEALYHSFPHSSPRKRMDEVYAARNPVLKWS